MTPLFHLKDERSQSCKPWVTQAQVETHIKQTTMAGQSFWSSCDLNKKAQETTFTIRLELLQGAPHPYPPASFHPVSRPPFPLPPASSLYTGSFERFRSGTGQATSARRPCTAATCDSGQSSQMSQALQRKRRRPLAVCGSPSEGWWSCPPNGSCPRYALERIDGIPSLELRLRQGSGFRFL